jgi:hypothetical protein
MTDHLDVEPRRLPGAFANLAPTRVHRVAEGAVFLYRPATGVVYTQTVGRLGARLAESMRDFGNSCMSPERHGAFFHEWSRMTGYDSESRRVLTAWAVDRWRMIDRVVVHTTSKLVAMGVATANLATVTVGLRLESHGSLEAFERAFLAFARRG